MFKSILIILTVVFSLNVSGQTVERKIILENNKYAYVSIDNEHQMGTLFFGGLNDSLSRAEKRALPAGRSIEVQTNPFSWDLVNDTMYAINFINHPLNDRAESIKKIALDSLKPWSETTVLDIIDQSIDQEMLTYNQPYIAIAEQSKYLNHFYFDGVIFDDKYWMAISNNDKISIWNYDGVNWNTGMDISLKISGPFWIFESKNTLYLLLIDGQLFKIDDLLIKEVDQVTNVSLNIGLIIDNRDTGEIYFLEQLNSTLTMNENIKQLSKKILN